MSEVEEALKRYREHLEESLSGFIGKHAEKTPEAWERVRQEAELWMRELSKRTASISFTYEGTDVTPEMIADWHFDRPPKTRVIDVKIVPKFPVDRIKIDLLLDEEE